MTLNVCLLVFAVAFIGCVTAIPFVARFAHWLGAVDTPDQFRRIHNGAVPRLGGIGLAFGLAVACVAGYAGGQAAVLSGLFLWSSRLATFSVAALIVLILGAIDDCRGLRPKTKLIAQTAAAFVLYAGGLRLEQIDLFGVTIHLSLTIAVPWPGFEGGIALALPSLMATLTWFLACMNIWNLIDGMDGLAAGVGMLVSGTLVLVAVHDGNLGAAVLAASLTGSLLGFLLFNWHPASIFLGDSGSLLVGLWLGIIGLDLTQRESAAVPLMFPMLAMGLPIVDTAMAIFRRWVRELPLSAADRRHVHHLLIGLGLTTRQAAIVLYVFTAGLCGVVLLAVAYRSQLLGLALGLSACLSFLLVITSRRDELTRLISDLRGKRRRRRQERSSTKLAWELVQRIELSGTIGAFERTLRTALERVCGDELQLRYWISGVEQLPPITPTAKIEPMTETVATFRLKEGRDLEIEAYLPAMGSSTEPDITLRTLQRVSLAAAQRLQRLRDTQHQTALGSETLGGIAEFDEATPTGLTAGSATESLAIVH
jgi:UDP-GlcNAc:undecaprenyl-phosphate GlcNAc-1-phosphate transferase